MFQASQISAILKLAQSFLEKPDLHISIHAPPAVEARSCGLLLPQPDISDPFFQCVDFGFDRGWRGQPRIDLAGLTVEERRAAPERVTHGGAIGINKDGKLDEPRRVHLTGQAADHQPDHFLDGALQVVRSWSWKDVTSRSHFAGAPRS